MQSLTENLKIFAENNFPVESWLIQLTIHSLNLVYFILNLFFTSRSRISLLYSLDFLQRDIQPLELKNLMNSFLEFFSRS